MVQIKVRQEEGEQKQVDGINRGLRIARCPPAPRGLKIVSVFDFCSENLVDAKIAADWLFQKKKRRNLM